MMSRPFPGFNVVCGPCFLGRMLTVQKMHPYTKLHDGWTRSPWEPNSNVKVKLSQWSIKSSQSDLIWVDAGTMQKTPLYIKLHDGRSYSTKDINLVVKVKWSQLSMPYRPKRASLGGILADSKGCICRLSFMILGHTVLKTELRNTRKRELELMKHGLQVKVT